MINGLSIGKLFNIRFREQWKSFDADYRIVGVVLPETIEDVESNYKLYSTYFTDLGLGLTHYTSYISSDTEVYICNKVIGYGDTIEYDSEKAFIPITLVDFDNSSEIIEVYNYKFVASNVRRVFSNQYDKDKYENGITDVFKKAMLSNIMFADPEISIQYASNKQFVSTDEAKKLDADYKSVYSDNINKQLSAQKSNNDYIADLKRTISFLNGRSVDIYTLLTDYKNLVISMVSTDGASSEYTGLDYVFQAIDSIGDESTRTTCKGIIRNIISSVKLDTWCSLDEWVAGTGRTFTADDIDEHFNPGDYIVQNNVN